MEGLTALILNQLFAEQLFPLPAFGFSLILGGHLHDAFDPDREDAAGRLDRLAFFDVVDVAEHDGTDAGEPAARAHAQAGRRSRNLGLAAVAIVPQLWLGHLNGEYIAEEAGLKQRDEGRLYDPNAQFVTGAAQWEISGGIVLVRGFSGEGSTVRVGWNALAAPDRANRIDRLEIVSDASRIAVASTLLPVSAACTAFSWAFCTVVPRDATSSRIRAMSLDSRSS